MFSLYCCSAVRVAAGFQRTFEYLQQCNPSEMPSAEILWKTRHKKVVRVDVPQEYAPEHKENYQAVWKLYGEKRFFRYLFRPSLAFREWTGYKLAESCGMPVAKVLAAAETRRGVRLIDSVFVTEFIPGTGDGDDFRLDGCHKNDTELVLEFAEKNLRLLAKLHCAGLVHGGFTPRNEIYCLLPEEQSSPGNRMDVIWIDLATCRKVSRLKRKKLQLKELENFLELMEFDPETKSGMRKIYFEELKKNG